MPPLFLSDTLLPANHEAPHVARLLVVLLVLDENSFGHLPDVPGDFNSFEPAVLLPQEPCSPKLCSSALASTSCTCCSSSA